MPHRTEIIVSSDTHRTLRLPPHQVETAGWPVLHVGPTPRFEKERWTFRVFGEVENPREWKYEEFRALPRAQVRADMHCVTTWSKLDNLWEGVSTRAVMAGVRMKPAGRFVILHCEQGFTTNLPMDDFLGEDCLFAWAHNGQDLTPDHGWPLRLVVPRLYAWKSAKWVRGVEVAEADRPGFWESWENGGYAMRGDPWVDERFRSDAEGSR
jgi:DMSO/TMAO reductase YedYZ molybdopterin-dependent catalytic subunit